MVRKRKLPKKLNDNTVEGLPIGVFKLAHHIKHTENSIGGELWPPSKAWIRWIRRSWTLHL